MAPTFEFEKGTQRYRYTSGDRSGQFVSFDNVHKLTGDYQTQQKDAGRAITDRLTVGEINTAEWMQEQAAQLKQAHINMFALGFGGHDRLGPREYGAIGNRLRGEYGYLRAFADEIQNGKLSEAQINARINLYYESLWQTYEVGREKAHLEEGFEWERRYTSAGEVCIDCVAFAARGWEPIGSLPPPGQDSRCRANCRCWKEYQKGHSRPQNSLLDHSFGWIGTMTAPTAPAMPAIELEAAIAMAQKFNPNVSAQDVENALINLSSPMPTVEQSFEVMTPEVITQGQSETEIQGFYWGEPNAEDMAIISQETGFDWSPGDWFVFPMRASDNLMWSSWECCWHPDILRSMAEQYPGQSFMLDHESSDIDESKGFFTRAALVQSGTIPLEYVNALGNGNANRDRLKQDGWLQVYLQCAIPASETGLIHALKTRQIKDVSTGSIVNEPEYYCPHCSERIGMDVPFYYKQENGEYFCPHEMPHPWNKMFAAMFGEEDINWADYAIMGTAKGDRHYETSAVGVGNLPSAEILRPIRSAA